MRITLCVAALGVAALVRCPAAESIPTEHFAKPPAFTSMRMSPDGEYVAFLKEGSGRSSLYVADFGMKKPAAFDAGVSLDYGLKKEIAEFRWVGDKRLVFTTTVMDFYFFGVSAVDRDGKNWQVLTGREASKYGDGKLLAKDIIYSFDEKQRVLMLDRRDADVSAQFPHVVDVDTVQGVYSTVVENPGNVVSWAADPNGVVRVGVTYQDGKYGAIYRDDEKSPWKPLMEPLKGRGRIAPLGFDASGKKVYVRGLNEQRRWSIYLIEPGQQELGKPVVEDPEYDVAPPDARLRIDGNLLYQVVSSSAKKALVGVRYLTKGPKVLWLDPEFAAHQLAIDTALPGTVNFFTSRTRNDKKIMVLAFSDRDPGRYYLYDTEKGLVTPMAARMPWIDPEKMAPMHSVQYSARDGLKIPAYLTLPLGHPPKNLPLVVMPHGGPWTRDVWEFDPLVQLLANRGYAVLQMNYRGSSGYGEEFKSKGYGEIGKAIQDDIEDGARWAVKKGLADPARVAIMGSSYGGYSALFALGKTPDLYKCGISMAGVSDWVDILKKQETDEDTISLEHWKQELGDPASDTEHMRRISPVTFASAIKSPVLIIQGEEDFVVPAKQGRKMVSALQKAGQKPDSLFLPEEGHSIGKEKNRVLVFKRIEAFLLAHLGPGVVPVYPAKK